jgi:hypothetical protein
LKPIRDIGPVIEAGGIFAYARKTSMIPSQWGIVFGVEYSQRDVHGILSFSSTICPCAYLNSKEPISQVVTDIKVSK